MFKNNSKTLIILGLVPFVLWLSLLFKYIMTPITSIIGILLFTTGYGVSSTNKKWIVASIVSLTLCCCIFFVLGLQNDYFKFIECYVAIIMAIYYGILHFFNYKLTKQSKIIP